MTSSPYGLEMIESCQSCRLRSGRLFCDLPTRVLESFEELKYATLFPKGAMLFMEGQHARGVFVLCAGRVKLTTCSSDGKAMITQIAEAGEVLGLSAAVSDRPYEVTAETLSPCQVNFVRREDFLNFLSEHAEACLRVAQSLSNNYHEAYEQARSLGLSSSVAEKLAKFILEWSERYGKESDRGIQLKLTLTHEEIAQLIGTSRESVTRLLSDFKHQGLIQVKGATLVVRDKPRLQALVRA
jgi:CRP/FNR family transcriptional regulator, cyclic AMP receptor protein